MKKIEEVLQQLSNLYEFNKKRQSFRLQKKKKQAEKPVARPRIKQTPAPS